ncbi:ribosome-binding factor A [Candidatus Nesciobacter abundans]|uniref:Ribosome-binding factor A n=1 Tax=Candidatus Nesciobacter abundans TaxID=2601668 RepID=A0A5C0UFF3_9PROT|nr:ribosome-binding factor A [Candidatus Nesciobacter abundans]QEK38836.1 ribosome-binding factor A [Candidatus Nesciobacter abundans]
MKPYKRNIRASEHFLDAIREIIWKMFGSICTVTRVKMSKDLKYADIYCNFINEESKDIIETSNKQIMNKIKQSWNSKYIPILRIHEEDKS